MEEEDLSQQQPQDISRERIPFSFAQAAGQRRATKGGEGPFSVYILMIADRPRGKLVLTLGERKRGEFCLGRTRGGKKD